MDRSPSVENLRHLQLMALLRDLVEVNGRDKASKLLGVSYRTLARAPVGALDGWPTRWRVIFCGMFVLLQMSETSVPPIGRSELTLWRGTELRG